MTDPKERLRGLQDALETRILVLDGAMGTMLHQQMLTAADGPALDGCLEYLTKSRPEAILDVHRAYLQAGSDIIETNSFSGSRIVLAEFGLEDQAPYFNSQAARLARQAADEFSTGSKPRWVAGSMGPTTKVISVGGGITFEQIRDAYYEQAKALVDGGVDVLLLETCNDTRAVKAGLLAIQQLKKELGREIPVMVSGTIEATGTMLAGQTADAFWASISHADLLSVGLNCATGPEFMTDHLRTLSELASIPVSCYPNAGLPNEQLKYDETPESLAAQLEKFVAHGWLNLVGGCCGTTDAHIRAIAQMVAGKKPRVAKPRPHRVVLLGHRAGGSGRKQPAADRGRAHQRHRLARVQEPDRRREMGGGRRDRAPAGEERRAHHRRLPAIDGSRRDQGHPAVLREADPADQGADHDRYHRPAAIELALTYCQGKSIINSINLEDGEEKFERVCPVARAYGAALIVGSIDEDKQQAQAFTRERKLAVAERSVRLLTEKYGIAPEDIVIDPLVFPCATGDANYIGGAVETIEAVRLIKEKIPYVKTVLGISNISFGLPAAAREVVNSVFLYYCTKAGLDLAIVNAEKLERFASIPEEERRLAESLLFNTPPADAPDEALRLAPEDWRAADARAEGRHQPVPHRGHRRILPPRGEERQGQSRRACRSISAWPTTSSKAPRTA